MAVVKADGYGHGLLPSARAAARAAGRPGSASPSSARPWRCGRPASTVRVLSWLHVPGSDFAAALAADVDLSVSARWALDEVAAAARPLGRTARIHLKVDTGLGRNGAFGDDWPDLLAAARRLEAEGAVRVVGVWSHFAYADAPDHPTVRPQQERFVEAVAQAERAGCDPEVRHLANSAATLTNPGAHFDLVRPGLAVYGLSPVPDLGDPADVRATPGDDASRPAWPLVKRVPAGQGVTYGHQYVTDRETTLALVPLGYADGIPRNATNVGPVLARRRAPHRRRAGLHGPVRRRPRPRAAGAAPATRSCSSAGAAAASRRPRTGPRRPGPSPTRSSPGSGPGAPRLRRRPAVSSSRRRTLTGLGVGLVAAGATAAAGVATDRLVRARSTAKALDDTDSYDVVPAEALVVIADDGVPLHVEIDLPGAARPPRADVVPTVVFSHGYRLNLRSWYFQRRALTAAGYRVVRLGPARPRPVGPRLRGVGHTSTSSAATWRRHRRGRARGPARARRALDGRHDDDVARRSTTTTLIRERVVAAAFVATSPGGLAEVLVGPRATWSARSCTASARSPSGSSPRGQTLVNSVLRAGQRRRGVPRRPLLASPHRCR